MNILRGVWVIVLILLCVTRCYIINDNYAVAEQQKQEQLQKEQYQKQEQLSSIYQQYSDYYLEFIKMDYNNIPEKVFDWGSYDFIIKKDDDTLIITFELINKETKTIVLTDTYQK